MKCNEFCFLSEFRLRKDHAPAKKPAETNVPGPSNAVPTEGPSNAAQMNASDFVEPNVPNDVSPINPSGFVHTGPTNDALVDAVQPGTSNLIPDNAATSAQGVSNPASMNIPSGVVQVDVNLLAPLDEDDLPGINNAANDGNQVLGNNDAPTGTVQSDFGDNYGLRRRDILEYFDATGRVQPHIDDPEFDAQQGDAAQVDAAQGNAAQDDAIQVDAPQADAPHVGRIDDVRGHHAGGRRPPNDRVNKKYFFLNAFSWRVLNNISFQNGFCSFFLSFQRMSLTTFQAENHSKTMLLTPEMTTKIWRWVMNVFLKSEIEMFG